MDENNYKNYQTSENQFYSNFPPTYSAVSPSSSTSSNSSNLNSLEENFGRNAKKKFFITGPQRKAANERERRRMNKSALFSNQIYDKPTNYSINKGFDSLRERLPFTPLERKLSKVWSFYSVILEIHDFHIMENSLYPIFSIFKPLFSPILISS